MRRVQEEIDPLLLRHPLLRRVAQRAHAKERLVGRVGEEGREGVEGRRREGVLGAERVEAEGQIGGDHEGANPIMERGALASRGRS